MSQLHTTVIVMRGWQRRGYIVKGQQVGVFGHLTYVCVWGAILGNMNKEHESNKVISH